jgi:hypothetical protein
VSSGDALQVGTLAADLLATVERHWVGAAGAPLPERRYVAAGEPRSQAWDCEQLTVSLDGIGFGPAVDVSETSPRAGSPASVMSVRHAVFSIALVRCIPGSDSRGRPPGAAELNAAGAQFMLDAGLLSQALVEYGTRTRKRVTDADPAALVQTGIIEPAGPSGKYVAVEGSVIITAAGLM